MALPPQARRLGLLSIVVCCLLQSPLVSSFPIIMPVVAANIKFCVKPELEDEFLQRLQEDASQTRDEPGALQFVVGQDVSKANTFHVHLQFKTQEAFEFHRLTPHSVQFATFCEQALAEDPVANFFHCQHEPQVVAPRPNAYCLHVESCIKPELRDEFVALMQQHQVLSRAEPECLQFDYGVCVNEPNHFYIHEEYNGKQGYDAHEATDHFERFVTFNNQKQPYAKPQVVNFFKTIL